MNELSTAYEGTASLDLIGWVLTRYTSKRSPFPIQVLRINVCSHAMRCIAMRRRAAPRRNAKQCIASVVKES